MTRLRTFEKLSKITREGVKKEPGLFALMPNHMSFYDTHLVCNPWPPFFRPSCNYSRQVAVGGQRAVIVCEGGMAAAKIDFRCHIGTEEFQCFLPPPTPTPSPHLPFALLPKRTLSFSEPAAPGVVCFLLFFQLESIDLTEWRAISDISPSLQACGVICWRFSAMLYVDMRPAPQKKAFFPVHNGL